MALRSAPLLLLVLVALRESCCGSSLHSLEYFHTATSDPSQGLFHFVSLGYVDGQLFTSYDSKSRRAKPRVSWMEKVGKDDPEYWNRSTLRERNNEEISRVHLETLRSRYNHSKGLHTVQKMYGCELWGDRNKGGFMQHGYDGSTYLTFDKETLTWVASDPQAQFTQRKCDAGPGCNQGLKFCLDKSCPEFLKKFLLYGKEALLRTETPMVTMSSRMEVEDGIETHVCRLDGFYPRDINASWRRDWEEWLEDTFHGSVAPNMDGTYHYWLSVQIDPKERGRYRCHVEHNGLQEPLELELKELTNSKSSLGLIIGCVVVAALVLAYVIAGTLIFFKRHQDDYKKAPTRDKGSSSSEQGSNQAI